MPIQLPMQHVLENRAGKSFTDVLALMEVYPEEEKQKYIPMFLEGRRRDQEFALNMLKEMTGQDFGYDVDQWRVWMKENADWLDW
jgi:hypothetical protein